MEVLQKKYMRPNKLERDNLKEAISISNGLSTRSRSSETVDMLELRCDRHPRGRICHAGYFGKWKMIGVMESMQWYVASRTGDGLGDVTC